MTSSVRLMANVFKLRIGVVIAMTALAGVAIQPGAAPEAWRVAVLALAILLSSSAAGAFNQYWERDLDARMKRTRQRPFVTGVLNGHGGWPAFIVALTMVATLAAWLVLNPWSALYTFLGAFVYAIVYTVWLKRRTWWNIVIGGSAGSFAVLAGAAAVTPALSSEALLLALVLFLWTPSHFWALAIACREDYAAAGVPMLPVVKGDRFAARAILFNTVLLVAASLWLGIAASGPLTLLGAAVGGTLFLRSNLVLLADPGRATAMRCFFASLVQLSLLIAGAVLDALFYG